MASPFDANFRLRRAVDWGAAIKLIRDGPRNLDRTYGGMTADWRSWLPSWFLIS